MVRTHIKAEHLAGCSGDQQLVSIIDFKKEEEDKERESS